MSEQDFAVFYAQKLVGASVLRLSLPRQYFNLASTVILFYEHAITIGEEWNSIWTQRWTISKVLYILMKYTAFVQAALILWQLGVVNEDGKACTLSFKIMGWLFVIGTGLGEMLLSIRTWAVWKKPRMMGYLLALFWCGVWGAIFAIMGVFLKTVRFDPNPDSPFPGCYISHGDQMERVLHAVFTGRVVLNIHRQSRKREELSYSNDGVILVPMTTTTNTFTDSQTKVPRGI
ncbi:hypothetical protein CC1G_06210 [Coprinopsis cinerea okayama7|uniref:DUF6533 domain-containing protein n=1 Tax=Coprinopsis cinerea (strain Okayama-7 / 130 / ATCC MYA-4618 / FGSC 9003) TaxID=240176 RepID=A8NV84_COPC7|nr:hypothetical protein CC1G_06210 [Coprinopsis cinerea okayama7\|eukprot:XP_001836623.2 hypothetical protein CC1G_06210 [Coprinopsis cinerea okayama7\